MLDPYLQKAYILKGAAYMKLDYYSSAKAILELGSSQTSQNPMFNCLLKWCNTHIGDHDDCESDSSEDDEEYQLKLYADFCTQAIDAGPYSSKLYCDRAFTLIKLRKYNEAIFDTRKVIESDPAVSLAYLLQGTAYFKQADYKNAIAVLESGVCYAQEDLRFAFLIKKCKEHFVAPVVDEAAGSTHLRKKPKYRHVFYNTTQEIVLSIYIKSVDAENVNVQFSGDKLRVSIKEPDEDLYDFQFDLFDKVTPEKCKYRILANEIKIWLAKEDDACWPRLSHNSNFIPENYEFSWIKKKLKGMKIVPPVRDQHEKGTCMFHSVTSATEMELKRVAALKDPPQASAMKFSANDFAFAFAQTGKLQCISEGLEFFKQKGVLTRGKGVQKMKYRIQGYRRQRREFQKLENLIRSGRPLVGTMNIDRKFGQLKPDGIYDYNPSLALKEEDGQVCAHGVVFVGFGWRDARPYLVFLNSWGIGYGDEGFGRVYLDHVYGLYTIDV